VLEGVRDKFIHDQAARNRHIDPQHNFL
jgi:hypothetical protein